MSKIIARSGVVMSVDTDKKTVIIVEREIGETKYTVEDPKLLEKLSRKVNRDIRYTEKDGQIDDVKGEP